MPGKLQNTPTEWVDPDDAPELDAEWFANATPMIGGREVSWEEFRTAMKDTVIATPPYDDSKVAFILRLDTDILKTFLAMGDDWERRINDALREWLKTNLPS